MTSPLDHTHVRIESGTYAQNVILEVRDKLVGLASCQPEPAGMASWRNECLIRFGELGGLLKMASGLHLVTPEFAADVKSSVLQAMSRHFMTSAGF